MHAARLAIDDELGEDGREPPVPGSVADVVLAGVGGGGVDDELVGCRVERRCRQEALDVAAVAGLGHREAPLQLARDDAGHEVVVAARPEQGHGAAEEAPLDAGLDEEREVAVTEHLEGSDRLAIMRCPALVFWKALSRIGFRGEGSQLRGDAGPVLVHGERCGRRPERRRVESAAVLADRAERAVEVTAQSGGQGGGRSGRGRLGKGVGGRGHLVPSGVDLRRSWWSGR